MADREEHQRERARKRIFACLAMEEDVLEDEQQTLSYLLQEHSRRTLLVELHLRQFSSSAYLRRKVRIVGYIENVVPLYSDGEFRTLFRISRSLFEKLEQRFQNSSIYESLREDKRMSAKQHLLIFLWFAGHEACDFRDLADRFNVSLSSVNRVLSRVICFLSNMSTEVINWPRPEQMDATAASFLDKCGMSNVVGAVDGTHIVIDPPKDSKDDYINRKGDISIVLQGICNQDHKFIDIFVGFPGSVHDSRVFRNSPVSEQLSELCQGKYVILGDSAYPRSAHVMTPFRDNGHLTSEQLNFNRRLGTGRIVIEHAFGILKQRFRQLYHCKLRGIPKLNHFIRACCVLHNLCIDN